MGVQQQAYRIMTCPPEDPTVAPGVAAGEAGLSWQNNTYAANAALVALKEWEKLGRCWPEGEHYWLMWSDQDFKGTTVGPNCWVTCMFE